LNACLAIGRRSLLTAKRSSGTLGELPGAHQGAIEIIDVRGQDHAHRLGRGPAPAVLPVLELRPGRLLAWWLILTAVLVICGTVSRVLRPRLARLEHGIFLELAARFDLDGESTVVTWFSSLGLAAASLLLLCVAGVQRQKSDGDVWPRMLLGWLFAFLALDESISLHELLINPLRRYLGANGMLYFTWVVPGFLAVFFLGLAYLRFLLRLPRHTARLFIASAAAYLGGALGLELVGGALAEQEGLRGPRYSVAMTLEETLEMVGIGLFLYSLLDYARSNFGGWIVRVFGGQEAQKGS
jgi:hypothetical protein